MPVVSRLLGFAPLPLRAVLLSTLAATAALGQPSLIVGPNVNLVAGDQFPNGDPFQRQQNEPSVAHSVLNTLHLLAGSNDYRAVDLPGLPGSRETGDSWPSYYVSTNGGQSWRSTLLPGYPQDPDCAGANPPDLCGNAAGRWLAGADPVVRAGAGGMFFYSGIVFDRERNRSAVFVSRFIDLNNDEGGEPIRFIDSRIVDWNDDGSAFLDKPWLAVDVPRGATPPNKLFLDIEQRDGSPIDHAVECGTLYLGYAAISGQGSDLLSQIRLGTSADCGDTWSIEAISVPGTLNQGASISIDPGSGAVHVAWRRFDTVEAFLGLPSFGCPGNANYWRTHPDDWPVESLALGLAVLTRDEAIALLGTNHRGDETIKLAYELIAAKLNLLTGGGAPEPDFDPVAWAAEMGELIAAADDWLRRYPLYSNPKQAAKKEGQNIKKAIQDILLGSGVCFAGGGIAGGTTGDTNGIVVWSSPAGGGGTQAPVDVVAGSQLGAATFDQGSTGFSFRTTAYPTSAVDASGRVYVAWAARGFAAAQPDPIEGDARVVIAVSTDGGSSWSPPQAIDDPFDQALAVRGHQIKPALLFAGGQLLLVYYDFRQDVSAIFERFVVDLPEPNRVRHTVDVRVAVALPGDAPEFTDYSLLVPPRRPSSQASRYPFIVIPDQDDDPSTLGQSLQLQYSPPNFQMFGDGSTPFIGDYVDLSAGPIFVRTAGGWRFATEPGDIQARFAVWTDNRDVRPPPDGDWTKYVPPLLPGQTGPRPSIFDPSVTLAPCQVASGDGNYTGTRNQNVYGALITEGLVVAAPGNNRPLGALQRGFVVFVHNVTSEPRAFDLLIEAPAGLLASFDQLADVDTIGVTVPAFSGAAVTDFASLGSGGPAAAAQGIVVRVNEPTGGLVGYVVLNPDPAAPTPLDASVLTAEVHAPAIFNPAILNPAIFNGSVEPEFCDDQAQDCIASPAIFNPAILNPAILNPAIFNPAIFNPAIFNPAIMNPAIFNPAIFNPAIFNPAILNPAILNPAIFNPAIMNPAILNPAILNPAIMNPAIFNPAILNPAILNPAIFNATVAGATSINTVRRNGSVQLQVDATFSVRNDGNVTTAYTVDLAPGVQQPGLLYEVLVFRLNVTPVAVGCTLGAEAQQQLLLAVDPTDPAVEKTFYLEPGEQVLVTFRVLPGVPGADPLGFVVANLSGTVTSQKADTGDVCGGGGSGNCDPDAPPKDQFGPRDLLAGDGNGGMETPQVSPSGPGWDVFADVPGWTIEWAPGQPTTFGGFTRPAAPLLELLLGNQGIGVPAQEGAQFAELDSDWFGPNSGQGGEPANVRIYQDLPTCPGATYTLSYAWRKRTGDDRLAVGWDVLVAGGTTVIHGGAGEATGLWFAESVARVATGYSTRLQFEEVGPANSLGTFLDAVSVVGPACTPP